MDGDKVIKHIYNVYLKIGEEEIKISSGEGTIKKINDAGEKLKVKP